MKRIFRVSQLAAMMMCAALLAACGPDRHAHDSTAAAQADRTDQPGTASSQPFDLCQLMPLGDVAGILQANGADTVTELKSHVGGACSYLHVVPRAYPARLLIDFTRMRSADQAKVALAAHLQDLVNSGTAVTPVPGVGDAAFAVESEGTEGLKLRVGTYQGQINLQLDGRDPASLRPAVLALAKAVLARLPKQ